MPGKCFDIDNCNEDSKGRNCLRSIVNKNDENRIHIAFVQKMATQQQNKIKGWEEWYCNTSTEDIDINILPKGADLWEEKSLETPQISCNIQISMVHQNIWISNHLQHNLQNLYT